MVSWHMLHIKFFYVCVDPPWGCEAGGSFFVFFSSFLLFSGGWWEGLGQRSAADGRKQGGLAEEDSKKHGKKKRRKRKWGDYEGGERTRAEKERRRRHLLRLESSGMIISSILIFSFSLFLVSLCCESILLCYWACWLLLWHHSSQTPCAAIPCNSPLFHPHHPSETLPSHFHHLVHVHGVSCIATQTPFSFKAIIKASKSSPTWTPPPPLPASGWASLGPWIPPSSTTAYEEEEARLGFARPCLRHRRPCVRRDAAPVNCTAQHHVRPSWEFSRWRRPHVAMRGSRHPRRRRLRHLRWQHALQGPGRPHDRLHSIAATPSFFSGLLMVEAWFECGARMGVWTQAQCCNGDWVLGLPTGGSLRHQAQAIMVMVPWAYSWWGAWA